MVIGLLGALIGVHPAAAHNSLVSSDPKNGAQLARPPAVIRLTFLSRLDPASAKVTLTGLDGRGAQGGAPRFDGSRVSIPFAPGPAGRYTISYRIVSSDGHPVTGAVRFTLIGPAAPANGARSATASAASPVASRAVAVLPSPARGTTGRRSGWRLSSPASSPP
jgi:copper resistance protein C